jgi:hypothetical protein
VILRGYFRDWNSTESATGKNENLPKNRKERKRELYQNINILINIVCIVYILIIFLREEILINIYSLRFIYILSSVVMNGKSYGA